MTTSKPVATLTIATSNGPLTLTVGSHAATIRGEPVTVDYTRELDAHEGAYTHLVSYCNPDAGMLGSALVTAADAARIEDAIATRYETGATSGLEGAVRTVALVATLATTQTACPLSTTPDCGDAGTEWVCTPKPGGGEKCTEVCGGDAPVEPVGPAE